MSVRQRLQTRLTLLYATLFGAAMVIVCSLTWMGVGAQAQRAVETSLQASGGVFDRLWAERAERVRSAAQMLSRDYGFRSALASQDRPTLASAVDNLRGRLRQDVAFVVNADGTPLTDGGPLARRLAPVLGRDGDAAGVVEAGGQTYEVTSSPVYAPELVGWLVFASRLDGAQMDALASLSAIPLRAEIVRRDGGRWVTPDDASLSFPHGDGRPGLLRRRALLDFAVVRPLPSPDGARAAGLLLHYPRSLALRPYRPILVMVAAVALFGLALVVAGSWLLARSVTRPIAALAAAALRLKEGEVVRVTVQGGGEVGALAEGFNAMVEAVAEREAQIRRAMVTDLETGLPSRHALEDALAAACAAAREDEVVVAAAFGVDRFARMRGVLGYDLTAELIKGLGERLGAVHPHWALARTAGDGLGVVFRAPDEAAAAAAVEAARRLLEAAVPVGAHLIDVRITSGYGCGRGPDLLRDAELALDSARQLGLRHARFDLAARTRAADSLGLMPALRRAISDDTLSLAHQPKWDVRAGAVGGVESLVRWTHPERGPVRPDDFIGLAEDTGDIRALTDWVVGRALRDQATLAAEGRPLSFSVNLSGRLIGDVSYTRGLLDTLAGAQGPVCLEITETAVIGDPEAALKAFAAFAEAGVALSIDDYGSGLSSLAYLKRIAAEELKLDRSLIVDLAYGGRDALLIRSTVDLAHALGMKVTAEGVEDAATMALLAGMGCDLIQGWHVARPLTFTALRGYLSDLGVPALERRTA